MDHISKRDIYDLIAELDQSTNPGTKANNDLPAFSQAVTPHTSNHTRQDVHFQSTDTSFIQSGRRPSNFEEWVMQEQNRIVPGNEISQEDRLDQVNRLREAAMHELNRLKSTAMHEIRDAIISFEQELVQHAQHRSPEAPSRPAIMDKQKTAPSLDEIQQAKRDILEELYAARESVYKQLQLLKRQKEEAQQENKRVNVQAALQQQLQQVRNESEPKMPIQQAPQATVAQLETKRNPDVHEPSSSTGTDLQAGLTTLLQKMEGLDIAKLKTELLAELRSSDQRFLQILKSNREEILQQLAARTAVPMPPEIKSTKMIWLTGLCVFFFLLSMIFGFMLLANIDLPYTLAL